MREDVIRIEYPADDPEAEYLCEVARRFNSLVLPGRTDSAWLLALYYILQTKRVAFDDGFVVNDLRDLKTTIGRVEAATVVAALDPEGRSIRWWNDRPFATPGSEADNRAFVDLLERVRKLPGVTAVE